MATSRRGARAGAAAAATATATAATAAAAGVQVAVDKENEAAAARKTSGAVGATSKRLVSSSGNSSETAAAAPPEKRQALSDISNAHATAGSAGAAGSAGIATAAQPARQSVFSTVVSMFGVGSRPVVAPSSTAAAVPPPPRPAPQPRLEIALDEPAPAPALAPVRPIGARVPSLRPDPHVTVVPDADVFRTTARADSVRAITNASSSPMTASSPGLYSDDGLDNDLATIEIADLTENPQDVREYAPRIMAYFRDLEVREREDGARVGDCAEPKRINRYMTRQRDINVGMRAMLVDWLVDVRQEFDLHHETLHLTVSLIDRFLSLMHVTRARLQLVGVSCLLVAAKYEEMSPPPVVDVVYITDNAFTAREVLMMESQILRTLRFEIGTSTSYTFATRFLRFANADDRVRHLTYYLIDLALLDYACLTFLPSEVAASAVILALHTLRRPYLVPGMEEFFNYSLQNLLEDCIPQLFTIFRAAPTQTVVALYHRYSTAAYLCVSLLQPRGTEENPLAP